MPCSAYTLRNNGFIFGRYNYSSSKLDEVGLYNESWTPRGVTGVDTQDWPLYELVLDPIVSRLNNDTFGDDHAFGTLGNDVVCRDYRYLANNSFPDGRPYFGRLNDAHGEAIMNKTCFVLLDANFGDYLRSAQGPARSGWRRFKPNAHSLWCSANRTNLGPGWLPLTLQTGLMLAASTRPDLYNLSHHYNLYQAANYDASPDRYSIYEKGMLRCPDLRFNTSITGLYGGHKPGIGALRLLLDSDNAWDEDGVARYTFADDHPNCQLEQTLSKSDRVFQYANVLGWDRSGVLFRQSRNGEFVDSEVCQNRPYNSTMSSHRPLHSAKLYASLRFQCSGLDKGVLCDFGVDPPLAVSPDGKYLSKRNMPDLPDVVIFDLPQTATSMEWAVIGMIIAVVASNLISFLFLACWPDVRSDAPKRSSNN